MSDIESAEVFALRTIYTRVEAACSQDHLLSMSDGYIEAHWTDLVRFESAIRADERERCAAVCDRAVRWYAIEARRFATNSSDGGYHFSLGQTTGAEELRVSIRALDEEKSE